MIVCLCKNISDRKIKDAISSGECCSLKELACKFGVARQCGKCAETTKSIMNQTILANISSKA